ncbi:MAG: uracil-DNA glycosylase [Salibacteraceae bacterium]|jgi:uracil-DNA glycosylase
MDKSKILDSLPFEWRIRLSPVINSTKFKQLLQRLDQSTLTIYPPVHQIFNAYAIHFPAIKVVIIGQDPYHGNNQAHGLSFSVLPGNRQPPSLKNIFKELQSDLKLDPPNKFMGDLSHWASQGIFLINSVLTVEQGNPNSHQNLGWEELTNATIKLISDEKENIVFILWGKFAQKKDVLIDRSKHAIISSPHPSPFSARKGFFGSRPFSKTNAFLVSKGQTPIDWIIK